MLIEHNNDNKNVLDWPLYVQLYILVIVWQPKQVPHAGGVYNIHRVIIKNIRYVANNHYLGYETDMRMSIYRNNRCDKIIISEI